MNSDKTLDWINSAKQGWRTNLRKYWGKTKINKDEYDTKYDLMIRIINLKVLKYENKTEKKKLEIYSYVNLQRQFKIIFLTSFEKSTNSIFSFQMNKENRYEWNSCLEKIAFYFLLNLQCTNVGIFEYLSLNKKLPGC